MKVQELIDTMKKGNVISIKKVAEIKDYLPFQEKKKLVNKILESCKEIDDNGFVKFNEVTQYIVFTIETIMAYTNVVFDNDFDLASEEYDALCLSGILGGLVGEFNTEYKIILELVRMEQDYMLSQNSIEYQVANVMSHIVTAIDNFSTILGDKVNNFDLKSLGLENVNANDLNKLMKLIRK